MRQIKRRILYQFRTGKTLRLRVRWDNNECFISSGYEVEKDKWSGDRCKRNTFHGTDRIPASTINKTIEGMVDKINKVFYKFEMDDITPSLDEFKIQFFGENSKNRLLAETAWYEFQREGSALKQWSDNTLKSVRQVQNLFGLVFPKIAMDEIDLECLNKFVIYQQTDKLLNHSNKIKSTKRRQVAKGYANNVITKNCSIVKRFLKWSSQKGYIDSNIVNNWHPEIKSIQKPVIFLTWDELESIRTLDLSENIMFEEIRDIFCFMCYTSLRYSDAIKLMPNQIQGNAILVTTQKTSSNLKITLNKFSKEILNKYLNPSKERIFPYHSNRDMNMYLKTIARLANIDSELSICQYYGSERVVRCAPKYQFISTHCGRRTFVCNALAMGIPAHVVIKWTGHSDLSAMKPYIAVADEIMDKEMAKFDNM